MNGTLLALVTLLGADLNAAGSVYLNTPVLFGEDDSALSSTMKGPNAEASLKVVADVDDHLTVHTKVCFGCHGFMSDMAYADYTVVDEFAIRFGRFPVPFGEFYLRYDPANHRSASKPLPYEMGRMLRRDEFNLGIVPQPYADNGVEVHGIVAGETVEFSYHAYVVAGLKGDASTADLDFVASRTEFFADNNRTPAVGGRAAVAFPNLGGGFRWLQLGASGMYGYYDTEDELFYSMLGVDLYARINDLNIRGEVMVRRTAIPDRPERYRRELIDLWVDRHGWYVQLDAPIGKVVEWLVRYDGLRRVGPIDRDREATTGLSDDSVVHRGTAGLGFRVSRAFSIKANYEFWHFEDFGREHLSHLGMVATF